jgi:lipoprotein-anchoring transpeptidase ErfK/SrfK
MTSARRFSILVLPAALLGLLLPAAAGGRPQGAVVPEWVAPTPAEGAVLLVPAGKRLTVEVAAQAPGGSAVSVQIRTSATRGTFAAQNGNPARGTFTWAPAAAVAGDHTVSFTASVAGVSETTRTIVVRVTKPAWPKRTTLSDYSAESYKWAYVVRRTSVRRTPSRSARAFSTLKTVTPEYFPNLVQTLNEVRYRDGQKWVLVRLAIRPNSSTGWVPRRALGRYRTVNTRLVVQHGSLRATLYRKGRPVFRTVVGVGQSHWPTPRGEFYVREVLSGYNMPVYGPIAMGISARSNVLTDWPGGGFIGIHGTNQPGILPGRVSHGCIRMRNAAILRLRRLMPLGTPVQVR